MRVVEIEDMAGNAIQQRSEQNIDLLLTPQHGSLARPRKRPERFKGAVHGFVMASADGAAEPVHDRTHGFALDRRWDL